jgi:hypothetical protein
VNETKPTVSKNLIVALFMVVLGGFFILQRGGETSDVESGFDSVDPFALIAAETSSLEPLKWEAPANPRNPFLTFDASTIAETEPTDSDSDEDEDELEAE